jgi:branched-chain amino acid transport system substrate-binding protein
MLGAVPAIVASIGLMLCSGGDALAQGKPVKIGMSTDLTGLAAAWARSEVNGVQLAIDEINASGGVLGGRKLELLVRDSQLKADLGASHTRDLITRENVDVLIGPIASGIGMTVSNMARQQKKVVLMAGPNTPRLTMENFHPHVFSIVPTGMMEARAMAQVLGPKFKRIAFIGADTEASHQGLKHFKDQLGKVNPSAQIVAEAWPKYNESDYSSFITSLMASKPDVVFSYLFGADMIGFVKQAKAYGVFGNTKLAGYLFLDDLRALGPEMPDGVIGQMRAPFFALEGAQADKFVEQYRHRHNEYPSDWAVMGYEALQILAQAIGKAGSLDSEKLVEAMEHIRYQGLRGEVTFRTIDHQGNLPSFIGVTAKDGRYPFKVLTDVVRVPAESVWPSREEIDSARSAK